MHPAVRPVRCVSGPVTGRPGRPRRPGWPGRPGRPERGRRVRVTADGRRIDGLVGQPLGRRGQVSGVGHREEPAHQDGPGGRGHRGPPAAQPGHPARFPACGLGREVCPARPGRRERPELREGPGLPGQFAAFRRRGQRGEYLVDRLPPGGVIVWRHAPAPRGPVQQRVNGPLPAGTVRPAAPLAFGHAAFETTRRPDALHGCDSRVPRPRWLTARIRGLRRPPPGSRPAAVNRGARPPGPPRDCGPPAGPRPGCPARRPPGAG